MMPVLQVKVSKITVVELFYGRSRTSNERILASTSFPACTSQKSFGQKHFAWCESKSLISVTFISYDENCFAYTRS
jgi:hypothetical protein